MIRWILFVLITAVLLAGSVLAYRALATPMTVEAAQAKRGPIEQFLEQRGKSRLPRTHRVATPFAGRVERVDLQVGQRVAQGEVLARMSRDTLDQQLAAARAAVAQRKARLKENADESLEKTLTRQTEKMIQAAVNNVATARLQESVRQEALLYARKWVDRQTKLAKRKAGVIEELEKAELAAIQSKSLAEQGKLDVQTQRALEQALRMAPQAIQDYLARKQLTQAVIQAEVDEAGARLAELEALAQRAVMRSPVAGVVLACEATSARFLPAGIEIARIGQLERLEVVADVLTEDAALVKEGQAVRIFRDASGDGEAWDGVVQRVEPLAFTKVSSLGVEQQRVNVIIAFRDTSPPPQLKVGYRLHVRILTDRRNDTLCVPRSALFRDRTGRWAVFAVAGGKAVQRTVEVGLTNEQRTEVVSGLAAGEWVVLAPENSLQDGMRVRIQGSR